jgi:hypothetical protein
MDSLGREITARVAELSSAIQLQRSEITYSYLDYMEYRFTRVLQLMGMVLSFPQKYTVLCPTSPTKFLDATVDIGFEVNTIRNGEPWRPRLDVPRDALETVLSYRLTGREKC